MDDNQDPKDPLETLKNIEEGKKPDDKGEPKFHTYVSRPDAELKQIAADIYNDKVFTDRFIQLPAEIPMVFMPIMLMDREAQLNFIEDLGMIFEYYSKAGPRGYNGYPIFLSLQRLDKRDSDRLIGFYDEYKAMQEKIKKEWGEQDISGLNNTPVNPEDYNNGDNY